MLDDTDWYTDWDVRVPRWVYYFPCPASVAYEYAKAHGWADTLAWGSSSIVANRTVEKLAESSGSKLVGVEMRACYDRELERIVQLIIVWRDNNPTEEEDRKEVGRMVTYLKKKLGLDAGVEPTWLLNYFQYQLEMGVIDDDEKPQTLTRLT